jgi:hypothetical protein
MKRLHFRKEKQMILHFDVHHSYFKLENKRCFFALSFPTSDAKRVEPSVDVANTVLVRNMRFASEKLPQKSRAKRSAAIKLT